MSSSFITIFKALEIFSLFNDSGFNTAFNVLLLLFTGIWVLSVMTTNASIVDLIWGSAQAIQVIIFYYTERNNHEGWETKSDFQNNSNLVYQKKSMANFILTAIITLHGLRLTLYLCIRNIGNGEDKRYIAFRVKYGEARYWWVSFFQVFLLQLALNMLFTSHTRFFIRENICFSSSAPNDISLSCGNNHNNQYNEYFMFIGAIIAHFGTWYEMIADWQLYKFKSNLNNKGKILNAGLWRYSRHPNYFGEIIFWWGTYLFNCSVGQYWLFYPSLFYTLIIYYVSGVSLTEKVMKKKEEYNNEFNNYLKTTPKFIPFIKKLQ